MIKIYGNEFPETTAARDAKFAAGQIRWNEKKYPNRDRDNKVAVDELVRFSLRQEQWLSSKYSNRFDYDGYELTLEDLKEASPAKKAETINQAILQGLKPRGFGRQDFYDRTWHIGGLPPWARFVLYPPFKN